MIKQYKGRVIQKGSPNGDKTYVGITLGFDAQTGRSILAIDPNTVILVPGRTFDFGHRSNEGAPAMEDDPEKNAVFAINVVTVDEVYEDSGCTDRNGNHIFDRDVVDVEGQHFGVYYSAAHMAWELAEAEQAEDGHWRLAQSQDDGKEAFPLHRLKKRLSLKAVVCGDRLEC